MGLSGKQRQTITTIGLNLLACSLGAMIGWAPSAIVFLESSKSDLRTGSFTPAQSGLMNSMYSVGGLIGSLLFSYLVGKFGRKLTVQAIAIPQIISYILTGAANNVSMLMLARVFAGISGGALFVTVPLFVSEIAQDDNRGALGSVFVLSAGAGTLLAYILGAYMRYDTCVWVYLALPIVYLMGSFYIRESPYFLLLNDRALEAEQSFMFYRNATILDEKASLEFQTLKEFLERERLERKVSWADFKTRHARKAIIIGVFMVALENFSGCFALLFYVTTVFKSSGATFVSPDVATMIVGLIQLIGGYCSTFLIDRMGRRPLLTLSAFGVAAGMAVFGGATQLIEHGHSSSFLKLVPVIALSASIFLSNVGIFSLAFVILSEVSPSKIKSHIFALCMSLWWIFTFIIFNLFHVLKDWLGLGGVMYFFAIYSFVSAIFVLCYFPETNQRSIEEIASLLSE